MEAHIFGSQKIPSNISLYKNVIFLFVSLMQTGLAKIVLEVQLTKLGLVAPEQPLPSSLRQTFQLLWANNGDVISKQYAGTNALKVSWLLLSYSNK